MKTNNPRPKKYTAPPRLLHTGGPHGTVIYDADNVTVAVVYDGLGVHTREARKALASLIARLVNAHDDLVSASACEADNLQLSGEAAMQIGLGKVASDERVALMKQLRAALATARGKTGIKPADTLDPEPFDTSV